MLKKLSLSSILLLSLVSIAIAKKGQTVQAPNYSVVFPQSKVNRIDIVITPQNWDSLQKNMEKGFGKAGQGGFIEMPKGFKGDSLAKGNFWGMPPMNGDSMKMKGGFPDFSMFGDTSKWPKGKGQFIGMPPGFNRDSIPKGGFWGMPPMNGDSMRMKGGFPDFSKFGDTSKWPKGMPRFGGGPGAPGGFGGFPGMGAGPMKFFTTEYTQCSIFFEGKQWDTVGIRFKGNSSLMMAWKSGNNKLPFRLNFDKYKNKKPENNNFLGFTELSFSNNNGDKSLLREKITADIFRDAGIKSARTAFYRVYIDYGNGPVYFGLYTAVEIVDDTMLKDQFGNDSGNCYKPDGSAATFSGSFNIKSFEKKNNKKNADWSDVESLFNIINSDIRTTNPVLWRSKLDSVLDVPSFIIWLAVNTTILNWDTYGLMSHNYYLYNNPNNKKLTWIPWDNNFSLMPGMFGTLSLSLSEVTKQWPLIRYVMDQPEYNTLYKNSMRLFLNKTFQAKQLFEKIDYFGNLIEPYVIGEEGEKPNYTYLTSPDDFSKANKELKDHINTRIKLANEFLSK
jgi:hypothetical protein